jgi:formate dehydrogenase subunit delta
MNSAKLARMANQIAAFFASYPEREAVVGIRDHLHAFWTPRMIETLRADAADGAEIDLHHLVRSALEPAPAGEDPVEKVIAGPDELGSMVSDAG